MSTPSTSASLTKAPSRLSFPSVRGMLVTTAIVAGAALLGVSAAGGSFASWRVAASVSPSTVSSGSLDIAISGPGIIGPGAASYAMDATPWSALIPGDVVTREVSVTNTGTVPVTLSVSTSPSTVIDVRVQSGLCAGTITGDSSTTTPATLDGTLAGGASTTVCIQVSLTPAAVQNQSAPFTMTFTGDQVRP